MISPQNAKEIYKIERELSTIAIEIDRFALLAPGGLKLFAQAAWSIVEPKERMRWNWHLDVLCEELERIELTEASSDTVINVPPGTMKSLLLVFFRARLWARNASFRFLAGSYGAHLSIRDNVKLRDIVLNSWYQARFPHVAFKGDQNAKERFDTTEGGWSIATSVGGVGTGEHPDYVFIDDPTTQQQAQSPTELQRANDWRDGTISTRGVARNVKTIVAMQRLDENDLSGHMLAKGGCTHICFPMRYEGVVKYPDGREELPDPRDVRTTPGELLWPELFPESKVKKLEIDLGEYEAAGQLQQRPAPIGGGLFKREWFHYVEARPTVVVRRVRGWDTAASEDKGDWTVGALLSENNKDQFFIEDIRREQLGPAGVDILMLDTARADGMGTPQRELREPAAAGKTVIAARTKLLKGYDHKEIFATGNKITMARPFRAQCEAGNVFLVRGEWDSEGYIRRLCAFRPGSTAPDDEVDSSSCAFNSLLLEPAEVFDEVTW